MTRWIAVLAAWLGAIGFGQAAPAALVEGVQMPAWLVRGGLLQPLAPGMELRALDSLRTGRDARVLLVLGEGSLLRLGEQTELQIHALPNPSDGKRPFHAVFHVPRGAFRLVMAQVAAPPDRRFEVRMARLAATLRGTDLWGKTTDEGDVICLIEGSAELQRPGASPLNMNDPLTYFTAPKAEPAVSPQIASLARLAAWAQETDLAAPRGALRRGGNWNVLLADAAEQGPALDVYLKARTAGYAASIDAIGKEPKRHYLVRIKEIASESGAQELARRLATELKLPPLQVKR